MSDKPNWQPTKAEYWHNLPAPARPWASEVAWFETYVQEKKAQGKLDVLILGSTVEFRSMCHAHGMNVHIIDFSEAFYHILTDTQKERMQHTGPETFYEQNWVTMDLEKQFDLIFGDWVPGVLHTKDYNQFYERTVVHLKQDGLFLGRECLRPDRTAVNLEEVVKLHYANWAKRYRFYETSMQYVYGYRPDPGTSMWNIAAAKEAFANVKDLMTPEDYDEMWNALAIEKEGSASIMVKENFERTLAPYFDMVAEHHGLEPSNTWYPIYVLKKK